MKMKFAEDFDDKHKKGFEVEVDKIRYDPAVTVYIGTKMT